MSSASAAPARAESARAAEPPCIWAVGGGKGGVGKSMVTSSIAVALAGRGHKVVVVDADLGGANMDTIFGVTTPQRSLSHFLSGEVPSLADVMAPTSVRNLRIIGGSNALLNMANPKHTQKEKFLRHVRTLPVDHVLLDLGAGSAYNTLDFFLAANPGILVVIPEPTSIENAYHFLKAAFFRSLRAAARNELVKTVLSEVLDQRSKRRVRSPLELIAGVMEMDRGAGKILREQAREFSPKLIVNQVRNEEQRKLGPKIKQVCHEHMGTDIDFLGHLPHDQHVIDAVHHGKPVLQLFPTCPFARELGRLIVSLLPTSESLDRSVSLPPLDVSRPGAYLRACRERLGLDASQVSERTQIYNLAALEEERFDALPPGPYVRNFVLAYARELGINEAEILAAAYVKRFQSGLAPEAVRVG